MCLRVTPPRACSSVRDRRATTLQESFEGALLRPRNDQEEEEEEKSLPCSLKKAVFSNCFGINAHVFLFFPAGKKSKSTVAFLLRPACLRVPKSTRWWRAMRFRTCSRADSARAPNPTRRPAIARHSPRASANRRRSAAPTSAVAKTLAPPLPPPAR